MEEGSLCITCGACNKSQIPIFFLQFCRSVYLIYLCLLARSIWYIMPESANFEILKKNPTNTHTKKTTTFGWVYD